MSIKVDIDELIKGVEVEKEHGPEGPANGKHNITDGDPTETAEIAAAHLEEMPNYYTELQKMEEKNAFVIAVENRANEKLSSLSKRLGV